MKRRQVLKVIKETNVKPKKKCKQSDDLQNFLTSLHKSSSPLWTLITTYVRETKDIIDLKYTEPIHWERRIGTDKEWQTIIKHSPKLAFNALDQNRSFASCVVKTLCEFGHVSILQSIRLKYKLSATDIHNYDNDIHESALILAAKMVMLKF